MTVPQIVLDTNVLVSGLQNNKTGRFFAVDWSLTMTGLNVEIPNSLYGSLQELASQDGISVDQFVATAVAEKIAALKTEGYLEALAKKGSREAYETVLARVPNVEPDEWDRWPAGS